MILKNWEVIHTFHDKLVEQLRLYYFIGGMLEVVFMYIKTKNIQQTRSLQQKLLLGYENDFAKYAPNNIVPKIRMAWNSITSQLAKKNRKFIYGQTKQSVQAKDFKNAINWAQDVGLILKIKNIKKPTLP